MALINEEVIVEVYGRKLKVEMEGMTQLEIGGLAATVSSVMKEISRTSETADSSKIAILTAMHFAAEYARLKSQHETQASVDNSQVEKLIVKLQGALEAK